MKTQSITIHSVWRGDHGRLLGAVQTEAFGHPWDGFELSWALYRRDVYCQVAETDAREIVGFVVYRVKKTSLQILNLAVRKDWRRLHVGRQLIGRLRDKLVGSRRRMTAEVPEENLAAQLFLRAVGMRCVQVICYPRETSVMYRFVYQVENGGPRNRLAKFFEA